MNTEQKHKSSWGDFKNPFKNILSSFLGASKEKEELSDWQNEENEAEEMSFEDDYSDYTNANLNDSSQAFENINETINEQTKVELNNSYANIENKKDEANKEQNPKQIKKQVDIQETNSDNNPPIMNLIIQNNKKNF